jgi:hypothetical protein
MKRLIYFILTGILIFATASSCKKGYLDVNEVPSQLSANLATPDVLLAGLLESNASNGAVIERSRLENWMGYWCLSGAASGDKFQTYNNITTEDITDLSTPKPESNFLEQKARELNQTFYEGIAKTMKALQWAQAVDLLNNIPYFEAYQPNIIQPKYDSGVIIYEDLIKQLDLAIPLIKNADMVANIRIEVADIMFHGDKEKWIRFINTLKLRLLVHQANRTDRAGYITQEINKIKTEGSGFLGTGENASINPNYIKEKSSNFVGYFFLFDFYSSFIDNFPGWWYTGANIIAMNFLKSNNDPRLGFIYSPIDEALPSGAAEPFTQPDPQNFRGNQFGYSIDATAYFYQDPPNVSTIGGIKSTAPVSETASGIIKGYDMPAWIITSIESKFLQAEAIQRGWITGNPEEAYKDAIKESFRWLNVGGNSTNPSLSDVSFDSWYDAEAAASNPAVSWVAAPDKYKLLMFQKYLAFNGIEPMEAWTDYRRNNRYPEIPVSADPDRKSDILPIRILYSRGEYTSNPAQVNAQGNINMFTSKIWWMP